MLLLLKKSIKEKDMLISSIYQYKTHSLTHARIYISIKGKHIRCFPLQIWCYTVNRRFPEITGKDNLTVFSYSRRVKSPEWRRQLRRADLRQFYIFRHGPIIIYTRVPSGGGGGGTYYPICMFPTNSERLIGISDAFSAFVYGYPSSCPRAHCTPNKSVIALHPQAWTCLDRPCL